MQLSFLLFFCFQGIRKISGHFCANLPKTLRVAEGDSATIPCTYTYDEDLGEDLQYKVSWVKPYGNFCSNIIEEIIHSNGTVTEKYKGRLSRVQDLNNKQEFMTIKGLKTSDGPIICCKVSKKTNNDNYIWYDMYGTALHFTGGKDISQLDELMAVRGEQITIPCHYPQEIIGAALKVVWYTVHIDLCLYNGNEIYTSRQTNRNGRYSLVNFPTDVSLRIHRVENTDRTRYCCKVTTSDETLTSRSVTELVIADSPSSSQLIIKQPNNITAQTEDSVTLNCSYTTDRERDVLWVSIYWRVGSTSGPYAYHPYQEMVDPSYRGRTKIKRSADLYIEGVQVADNTSYHCFVMLKLCERNDEYGRIIHYGKGTRLIVKESPEEPLINERDLVIIISISASVILILCVILIVLKAKGIICKKKRNSSDLQMNVTDPPDKDDEMCEEMPYCEIDAKVRYENPEQELTGDNDEGAGYEELESGQMEDHPEQELTGDNDEGAGHEEMESGQMEDHPEQELTGDNDEGAGHEEMESGQMEDHPEQELTGDNDEGAGHEEMESGQMEDISINREE